MAIDYERMKRVAPRLKAALTRAQNRNPLDRYEAVLAACKAAVKEWNEIGAWPDGWARWEVALRDAARYPQVAPRLSDLE